MNNSEFKSFEIAALKNTAKIVNSLITKRDKTQEKINALQKELDSYIKAINKWEAPIIDRFGYSSEHLINKVVEDTGKVDKNGNPIKTTKYVLKYKDVLPPYAQNNESNNCQVTEENKNEPSEEEVKEMYEDYVTQQAVEESKIPTTDLPLE